MVLPDYNGGSLVNLINSISKACGGKTPYPQLKLLPGKELTEKNIVLILIDALGYKFLEKHAQKSFIWKHLRGKMTSVFPSHTACCITSLFTGVAPQQHAIVGWHTYFKEVGSILTPLPYYTKFGVPLSEDNIDPEILFTEPPIMDSFSRQSYFVYPSYFDRSAYNNKYRMSKNFKFKTLRGMFSQATKAVKFTNRKKFVYVYWDWFDNLCHEFGPDSKEVIEHFRELDAEFERFICSIASTNSAVILTADHGQTTISKKNSISLRNHPKMEECLSMPLLGTGRTPYCFVRPSKEKQFVAYVKKHFSHACTLHKTTDLIKKGYFGKYAPNKRLWERTGDYILLMKDGFYFQEQNVRDKYKPGHHGGISEEEMYSPIVLLHL